MKINFHTENYSSISESVACAILFLVRHMYLSKRPEISGNNYVYSWQLCILGSNISQSHGHVHAESKLICRLYDNNYVLLIILDDGPHACGINFCFL